MQFALAQHQTSKPIAVKAGSYVAVTPAAGATVLVEYSSASVASIADGSATWSAWSYGTTGAAARDFCATAVHARVTSEGGAVTVDVHGVAEDLIAPAVASDGLGGSAGLVISGKRVPWLSPSPTPPEPFELMPFSASDLSFYSGELGQASAPVIDTNVLYNGKPTLRIDIPANATNVRVGTGAFAKVSAPYNWDLNNLCIAVRSTNANMLKTITFYLGDVGNTNFWTTPLVSSRYGGDGTAAQWVNANEWWVPKTEVPLAVNTGAPALADGMRAKLSFGVTASSNPESIWIGLVGVLPKRKKPTIIFELDDGFASWYDFIRPLAKHYDLPVTMNINSGSVGTGNYLTWAQIQEMHKDPSNLFDFCNHASVHQNYTTVGAAVLAQRFIDCAADLRSKGGVDTDGPMHATYPNFVWGNDIIPLLANAGFLTGRSGGYRKEWGMDQMLRSGKDRKAQYTLNTIIALGGGTLAKTLADAQAAVNGAITDGTLGMINAHNFAATATDYVWDFASMRAFMGWVAAQRDAGNIEVKSRTRWYADLTGGITDRR